MERFPERVVAEADAGGRADPQPTEMLPHGAAERGGRREVIAHLIGSAGAELVRTEEALDGDVDGGGANGWSRSLDREEVVVARRRARLDVELVALHRTGLPGTVLVPHGEAAHRQAAVVDADHGSLTVVMPERPQSLGHGSTSVARVAAVGVQRAVRMPARERTLEARHRRRARHPERGRKRPSGRRLIRDAVRRRAPLRAARRGSGRDQLRTGRTDRLRRRAATPHQRHDREPHAATLSGRRQRLGTRHVAAADRRGGRAAGAAVS